MRLLLPSFPLFLGKQLSKILNHLEENENEDLITVSDKQGLKLDIPQIPELLIDNTDRNRTSPFAFTGNRFEFRAVGSEANCASAMIALNAALANQLIQFKTEVDQLTASGEDPMKAILTVIRRYIKICKPIRFDGNGYSDEWKAEAQRRGLDCETSCPVIFDNYLKPDTIAMFETTDVMRQKELEARNEVKWETYTKKILIEARVLGDLTMNHIIPIATEYQSKLIDNVHKMSQLFDAEKAIAYHDDIAPMLETIRYHIDKLELIVDNEMWTLPKYRELLFIR